MDAFRSGFNGFLSTWDTNARMRRKHLLPLLGSLVASSFFTFVLSTFVASGYWLQDAAGTVLAVVVMLLETFACNVMFTVFLVVVRGGTYGRDDLARLLKTLPKQLVCFVITYLMSACLMLVCRVAACLGPSAYSFVSTFVALCVTLVNAGVAFGCYDGQKSIGKLISGAFDIVLPTLKRAAFALAMFLLVSLVVALGYSLLITSHVESYTYNAVMDFFLAGNVGMGVLSVALNVVNYVVSGYFEMDVLIAAAKSYGEGAK